MVTLFKSVEKKFEYPMFLIWMSTLIIKFKKKRKSEVITFFYFFHGAFFLCSETIGMLSCATTTNISRTIISGQLLKTDH